MRPLFLLLFSATLGLACDQARDATGVTRVDSAGVEVVTIDAANMAAAPRWSLSSQPVRDIGSDARAGLTLFRVVAAVPLSRRAVAIGMTAPPQVVLVDSTGTRAINVGEGWGRPRRV